MIVKEIRTTPFRIPLQNAFGFATGTIVAAEHILVEVLTEDGVIGVAEAIPRPMIYGETMPSVRHAINDHIAPQVIGLHVGETSKMLHVVRNLVGNPAAKSSVELAMMDALGKSLGVPCFRLLGAFTDTVRTNFNLPAGSPERVVEVATQINTEHGITAFKAKVGIDLDTEVDTVLALRAALPGAEIVVDANHGFSAVESERFIEATADARLVCVEEPCPAEERLGRQRLCARSPVPIMGDESCATLREVASEVTAGACTMVSIKLARTAIAGSSQVRDFCLGTGTPVVIGSQGDTMIGTLMSAAFAAAAPSTNAYPSELTYYLDLEGDLCAEPVALADGVVRLPERPGFGFEIDREKLAHYRVD